MYVSIKRKSSNKKKKKNDIHPPASRILPGACSEDDRQAENTRPTRNLFFCHRYCYCTIIIMRLLSDFFFFCFASLRCHELALDDNSLGFCSCRRRRVPVDEIWVGTRTPLAEMWRCSAMFCSFLSSSRRSAFFSCVPARSVQR